MNIHLLRHGIAVKRGSAGVASDAERVLTDEGRAKTRRIARAMQVMELEFDLILSSPYARARQTAEMVADRLTVRRRLRFTNHLAPEGNRRALIKELGALRPRPKSLLLVGHEPYLTELAAFLLTGNTNLALTLKKGGLCRLSVEKLALGPCAALEWWLTPKQMGLMAA